MTEMLLLAGLAFISADIELPMNHIQVVGTHNSYHLRPNPDFLEIAKTVVPEAAAWDYEHASLPDQLDRGVRNFELDLHHFADGFKVLHVPHYDQESTCPVLRDCLEAIQTWSEQNRQHIPISVLLELKEAESRFSPVPPVPVDRPALDALDALIREVFGADQLLTPDDVRKDAPTLDEAVRKGWPKLEWARGRVMFVLHERGHLRQLYVEGRPALEGCAMFVESTPGEPFAATLIMNNPSDERIPERVREGYWVRTRADSGLSDAKRGTTERRDQAFASGAHVVTTDFPNGEAHPETGYVVKLEDGAPARHNPLFTESATPVLLSE